MTDELLHRADQFLDQARGTRKLLVLELLAEEPRTAARLAEMMGAPVHSIESHISTMYGAGMLVAAGEEDGGQRGRKRRLYKPNPHHPAVALARHALALARGERP